MPTTPLAPHLAARLSMATGPSWMVAAPDGLWVKADDGSISRVDTTTNKVMQSVVEPDGYCQGIGASPRAVWTCSGRDVLRYDLAERRVTYRWTGHKVSDQGEFPLIDGRIWLGAGDARTLQGIDPDRAGPDVSFAIPVRVTDVGVCTDQLWVVSEGENRAIRVDPTNGKVLLDVPLDGARALACNGEVWAAGSKEAIRIDPENGRVLARVPVTGGMGVAIGDHFVWIRAATPFLAQIDRSTSAEVAAYSFDEAPSAGDVTIAGGAVWLCTSEEGVIARVDGGT